MSTEPKVYWGEIKDATGEIIKVIEYDKYQALEQKLAEAVRALTMADNFFMARDRMNAEIHVSAIRLSPLTMEIQQALALIKPDAQKAGDS
jgi:hypothetical protein